MIVEIAELRCSVKGFDCGVDSLNDYLHRFAKQNDRKNIGRTYVLVSEENVGGYYTLSSAEVGFSSLPIYARKGIPKYPIPAARLGRLAVDRKCQGRGYGEMLLMDAIDRVWRASNEVAIFALVVDALNENARNFYRKFGFSEYHDEELKLFLPLKTVEQLRSSGLVASKNW